MQTNMRDTDYVKLNEVTSRYQNLLRQTHYEALAQNEVQVKQWQEYRHEHEDLKARLLLLRDQLTHPIMVPIGKHALMRGSLVHTNEVLVCLGDGWFAKKSAQEAADVCQRRIQNCNDILEKLRKEEELLSSRQSLPFESEAFCGDQTKEVIEPYDEEAEKKWKERHRQKEREYRQKLAELKKTENSKIETEEDLWNRLDALDMQEELEDELNRMDEDVEDETGTEDSDDNDSDSKCEEESDRVECGEENSLSKRKVSFQEVRGNEKDSVEDKGSDISEDNNCIRIAFKHSDVLAATSSQSGGDITSPAEVYAHYLKNRVPRSILKPSPSVEPALLETPPETPSTRLDLQVKHELTEPVVQAVGEVVERTLAVDSATAKDRPVSRFKAARLANKR